MNTIRKETTPNPFPPFINTALMLNTGYSRGAAEYIVMAVNCYETREQLMRHVSSELRNLAVRSGRGEIQNQLHALAEDLYNATISKAEADGE